MQAEEIISSVTSKCDTSEGGCHGPPRAVVNHGGGCVSHNLPRHCPSSPSALLHLNPASPPYPLDGYRTALRRRTIRLDSGMYPDELSTTSSTSGVVSSQWDGYSDTSFLSSTAATPTSTIPIPSQQPRRPQQGTPSDNDDEDSSRCVPARTCGPGQRSAAHSREARPTAEKRGPQQPSQAHAAPPCCSRIPSLPFPLPFSDDDESDTLSPANMSRPSRRWGPHNPFGRSPLFRGKSRGEDDNTSVVDSIASSLYCSSAVGDMSEGAYMESLVSDDCDIEEFSPGT